MVSYAVVCLSLAVLIATKQNRPAAARHSSRWEKRRYKGLS